MSWIVLAAELAVVELVMSAARVVLMLLMLVSLALCILYLSSLSAGEAHIHVCDNF
jgi:hypothetical protein